MIYSYKGELYTILEIRNEILCQYKNKWYPIVVYTGVNDKNIGFQRSIKEFFEKFELVREGLITKTDTN